MSLIYWVGSTKTDTELVLPKHGILSPLLHSAKKWERVSEHRNNIKKEK